MDVPQGGPSDVELVCVYLCGVVCESVRERSSKRDAKVESGASRNAV